MTLIEHLDELRSRIIKVAMAFFMVAIVALHLYPGADLRVSSGARGTHLSGKLIVTWVTEQLFTDMKLALYVGPFADHPDTSLPGVGFCSPCGRGHGPGVHVHLITLASCCFWPGLPSDTTSSCLSDSTSCSPTGATGTVRSSAPSSYLQFMTRFLLAFGIVFEFPAATYVAAKMELVDAPLLKKYRKHAIILNTVLAAALTPGQDPFSMILMAVPMIVMYEISILIARYVNPTTEVTAHELVRDDENEAEEREADEPEIGEFEGTDDHPENGHERDL